MGEVNTNKIIKDLVDEDMERYHKGYTKIDINFVKPGSVRFGIVIKPMWFYLLNKYVGEEKNIPDFKMIEMFEETLEEDFISAFRDCISMTEYLVKYEFSTSLLDELNDYFTTKLEWLLIGLYQKLDEEFMDKYADKLKWDDLYTRQVMSPEFIEKHKHRFSADLNMSHDIRFTYNRFVCAMPEKNFEEVSNVPHYYRKYGEELNFKMLRQNISNGGWDATNSIQIYTTMSNMKTNLDMFANELKRRQQYIIDKNEKGIVQSLINYYFK